ncbi:hypothetical protein TRVL_06915 [Trypanosoma vivax]|nr:hypothetical protein TRVL_06915 [Trypanosoma vivax]
MRPVKEELLCQQSICRASDCSTSTTWPAQPQHLCRAFTASHVAKGLFTTEHRSVSHANLFRGCSFATGGNSLQPPDKAAWICLALFTVTAQPCFFPFLFPLSQCDNIHSSLHCFLLRSLLRCGRLLTRHQERTFSAVKRFSTARHSCWHAARVCCCQCLPLLRLSL